MRKAYVLLVLLLVCAATPGPSRGQALARTHVSKQSGPAVLGALESDWIHALGKPMRNSVPASTGWHPCPNGVTAGILVFFLGNRAINVTGQACGTSSLSMSVRRAAVLRYMPRDAVRHGSVVLDDGSTGLVYISRSLGRVEESTDCNSTVITPGTFTVEMHADQDSGWSLTVGTCP